MEGYFRTSDDVRIAYRIMGNGPRTLLFLHGWGGSQLSYDPTIKELKGNYRVITYDHRGFGASGKPDRGYSVARLAEDLRELMESLDLKDVVLVGWSMGGVVASTYLHTYGSGRVSRLILVDVNRRMLCDEEYTHGFYDGAYTKAEAFRDAYLIATDFRKFVEEMPVKANMTLYNEALRKIFVDAVVDGNPQTLPSLAMWVNLCWADLKEAFAGFDIPVLFCHGGTSTYCPPKACEYVMGLFQRGTLKEFPECSHFLCTERPAKFAQAIDEYMAKSNDEI